MKTVLLALVAMSCCADVWEPILKSHETPRYPPLARLAQVGGTVVVELRIDAAGTPSQVEFVSGHPLLKQSALQNARTWRFVPTEPPQVIEHHRVTYIFELSDNTDRQDVVFEGANRVTIRMARGTSSSDCPDGSTRAIEAAVSANDSVKLAKSGCYGTCPSYEVRVFGSGRVEWTGHSFVEISGPRTYRIEPSVATKLIERFRTRDVQNLCGDYTRSVTDNPSTLVEIEIGGRLKVIHDYAASSPTWFQSLRDEIDLAADTHRLRHGDPAQEPLIRIQDEYLHKPGKTALMEAARKGDLSAVRGLLAEGAPVDATDASGWTALMYAVGEGTSQIAEELIRAGARANHVSPAGDTVLMAAALGGFFDEDLAKQGGNINAQNADGVTALMLLAARGEPDEIRDALKAGANRTLRDRSGHVAIDYLEATACFRSLVKGYQSFMQIAGPCNVKPDKDFRKAQGLLQFAGR